MNTEIKPEIVQEIAAAYARRSTLKQEKSIPEQIAGMRQAAEKKGYLLPDDLIFSDDASGTSTKNRHGLEALRKAVHDGTLKKRGVTLLFYWATDRLGRNLADSLVFEAAMAKQGIRCLSVTEEYDVRTLGGKTMFVLKSLLAEEQNKRRAVDIKRGQRSAVLSGRYVFKAPFGYTKNADRRLCINVPQAAVIRRMFQALLAGKSPRQITQMLNEAKVPSPRGKRWQHSHVGNVLRNETFAGICVHGLHRKLGVKNLKRDTAIVEPAHHPSIIDLNTFIAAQKVLDERSRSRRFTRTIRHLYLFGGLRLLKCGCGTSMVGKRCIANGVNYFYYQCLSRLNTGQACGLRAIPCRRLDETVLTLLADYAGDRQRVERAWAKHHKDIAPQVLPVQEEIAAIDQKLVVVRQRKERLGAAFAEAEVALPVLKAHVKQLSDEEKALESRRHELSVQVAKISKTMSDSGVLDKLTNFRATFDSLSHEGKKMLIRTLVASITIKAKDQFEIALRFMPAPVNSSVINAKNLANKEA